MRTVPPNGKYPILAALFPLSPGLTQTSASNPNSHFTNSRPTSSPRAPLTSKSVALN